MAIVDKESIQLIVEAVRRISEKYGQYFEDNETVFRNKRLIHLMKAMDGAATSDGMTPEAKRQAVARRVKIWEDEVEKTIQNALIIIGKEARMVPTNKPAIKQYASGNARRKRFIARGKR